VISLGRRMVKKECWFWAVPSVGFIVLIEFDFEVDLHKNNNNSIYNLYVFDQSTIRSIASFGNSS
jgi:hypothetical protein